MRMMVRADIATQKGTRKRLLLVTSDMGKRRQQGSQKYHGQISDFFSSS
jgi:hypothetical protein